MLNKGVDGMEISMVMLATDLTLAMNKPNFKLKIGPAERCTYCHNSRHTRDKCFKLIGYPDHSKDKKKKQGDPNQYRGEVRVASGELIAKPAGASGGYVADGPRTADRTQAAVISVLVGRCSLLLPVEYKESLEGKRFLISNYYHTNVCDWIIDPGETNYMAYSEKYLVKSSKSRRTKIVN